MNLSKDRETQQQSYFYVVWPEDKSPGGTSAATVTLSSTAVQSSAATNSTAALSTPFNYDSQIATASSNSGSCSTSSLHQRSPVGSPLSKEPAACMASEQVMTSTNASAQDTSASATCSSRVKSQPVQQLAAAMPIISSSTVASSTLLDSFTAANSPIGRQRTVLTTPDLASFGRPRVFQGKPGSPGGGETNLREIGKSNDAVNVCMSNSLL